MTIFQKKLNKKGFTLAELLIVIAILAILVAIAIPIFTGQLQKAKIARDQANVRSAKGQAITYLLSDEGAAAFDKGLTAVGTDATKVACWKFEVTFKSDGNINTLKCVEAVAEAPNTKHEGDADAKAATGSLTYKGDSFDLYVTNAEVDASTDFSS